MKTQIFSGLLGCLLMFGTTLANDTDSTTVTSIGQLVPDFKFRTDAGKTMNIKDLRGKIILINFFATWCSPCKREMPELQKEWLSLKEKDFFLISIGREETMQKVKNFKQKRKLAFPMAPDPERKIYKKFATKFIPRNIVIDKNGRILFQSEGFNMEEFNKMFILIKEKI